MKQIKSLHSKVGEGKCVPPHPPWTVPEENYPLSTLGVGLSTRVVVPGIVPRVVPEALLGLFIMLKRKSSNTRLMD